MIEKWSLRVEYEKQETLHIIRPHRQFFGRRAVTEPLLVEIEFEENESLFGCIFDEIELASFQAVLPGRSVAVERVSGLIITPDPQLFGTDADRTAAGKVTFKQLKFGEWNIINLEQL